MTETEYRRQEGISRSELWRLRESPEKFKWYQEHPEPATPALIFGAAVHKLLLEPETFADEFAVAPECDRRTKDGREAYNAFLAASDGKSIISLADYEKAVEMAQRALEAPFVEKLLDGEHEKPFFWVDDLTGEKCKCRVDCITNLDGKPTIIDYKTAKSAATHSFNRSIYNYGYHVQAAMYSDGVMAAMGLAERPDFVFIVQEKDPPYAVNIVTVPPEVMLAGLDKFRELIGIYHQCRETGYWYGYTGPFDEPNEAYLLEWVKSEADLDE